MRRNTILTAALVVLLPVTGWSQSLDAVMTGKVSDATGATVPGATVTASSEGTGLTRSAVTDRSGHYVLLALPAGTYGVRAELDGFEPDIRVPLAFSVGSTVTLDMVLKLAGIAATVDVRGEITLLETSKSTLTRLVQSDEIDQLPVVNRNFNDLAALAPGVTKTGVYGGVDVSGSRDFQNGYQVDGVSAERQRLGDQRMAYAQDWIQEFQVMTGQFNAEFGQAAGGVVNVITRSGANQVGGRAYAFFRNDAWDAMPAFTSTKPPLDEHRFGATVGGPVVSNRVFYFVGVERFSNTSSNVVNSSFASANGTFPSTERQTLSLLKLDAVASPAHSIRLRNNGQRQYATGSAVGGVNTREHGRSSDVRANDTVGNWTWIVAPTTLNEARIAWSTSYPASGCVFATENPAGTWFERSYPGAKFGCPVNFGTIGEDHLQLVENLSSSRGRHDFKLGVQTYWTRSFGDFRNLRDGRYSFERDVPFSPNDPNSFPFSFSTIEGPTAWDVGGWSTGMFIQDTWRTTNDFTMSLGLRYDVDGSLTALNSLVRLDKGLHTLKKDLNNIAPRVGLAWTPFQDGKRTLVRGGAGLYYDQNHNNVASALLLNNILVDRVVSVNANNSLLNPFWPDVAAAKKFLADALAQNRVPDVSTLTGLVGATNDLDRDLRVPATTQLSTGIEHEFRRWLNASADFVYARGFDLYVIRDVNLDPVTFQRVNPNYSAITSFGNGGWNAYKALQVQVNVLPNGDRLLKAAYTLATNRSNTAATLSTGVATNPFDYSEDVGPSDNDVRHTLAVNGSTMLPVGVQVSGILSYRTALPYSATTNATRPDGKPFSFRPEPRNARRGDGALSLDLRLAKVVRLGARRSASAFVEVFNLTNEENVADYIGTVTSSQFGQPTTAGPKRRAQLGFRVDF